MRRHYVHQALVKMPPDADQAALGGAVTVALCGDWDHACSCSWPHNSRARGHGDLVELRTVFVAHSSDELLIRSRIDTALQTGSLTGPDESHLAHIFTNLGR